MILGITPDLLCSVHGLVSAVPIVCVFPEKIELQIMENKKSTKKEFIKVNVATVLTYTCT